MLNEIAMNYKIAPSLLSADMGRFAEEISAVTSAGADILHLDIMDGHFVPNLTFGVPIIRAISKVSTIPLDAHFMVSNPDFYIEPCADMGITYFSFHIEAVHHSHRMIQKIKKHSMKAGIALNPGTPVSSIIDLLTEVDFVLIMSVNPGFGGQKFIDFCLDKIKYLNKYRTENKLNFEIEIDGGVSSENIQSIVSAGTDIIVAGSFVFEHTDYAKAISALKKCEILLKG
jgi:ribulose-phosphate 3-epimerase